MTIKVKLSGSTVSVHPMSQPVTNGRNTLDWGPHEDSDTYTFADPAITFDDSDAPISGLSSTGNTATATDTNSNSGGQDQDYTYHVHLIDGQGNPITWPPTTAAARARTPLNTLTASAMGVMGIGDPTIKNKPV